MIFKHPYFVFTIKFGLFFLGLNLFFNMVRFFIFPDADIPPGWPVSILVLRMPSFIFPLYSEYTTLGTNIYFKINPLTPENIIVALIYIGVFYFVVKNIDKFNTFPRLYFLGALVILLCNLIQGVHGGLYHPVAGLKPGETDRLYYQEALKINSTTDFMEDYNYLQSTHSLADHAIVHPPGSVLIYYYLDVILVYPELISVSLLLISLFSVYYVRRIFLLDFDEETANFVTLVFLFIPAVQIYYLSCIDSIIALFMIGTFYHFEVWSRQKNKKDILFASLTFICAALFTYTIFYLFAILVAYSYSNLSILPKELRNNLPKADYIHSVWFLLIPVGFYMLLVYFIFDFNYIAGILETAKYENRHFSHNILLLDSPTNYIFTRLECISEIIFMFGGLCAYFSYKSLIQKNENMMLWTKFAILFFMLMILTGAYRTGETARPFLGIYPLLLIPFAYYIKDNIEIDLNSKKTILFCTFFQSIILQTLFWFYW